MLQRHPAAWLQHTGHLLLTCVGSKKRDLCQLTKASIIQVRVPPVPKGPHSNAV